MEATAQGRTEKSFGYVVRVPSDDGFDVMNVDVKIDTSWIFRDVEEGEEEQGCLLGAAASSQDVDTGTLRKQLESSEQKLLAAVDKCVTSESGLRNRIQELELSEKTLLQKVEQLHARVFQERSISLRAQEQLEALQGEMASWVREEESVARRHRWRLRRLRERLRRKDEALGRQAVALERCRRTQRRQLGLAREQERALRAQVQRLERDVRRLCRATGLLLAELDAAVPGSPRPRGPDAEVPAGLRGAREDAAEPRALQARAERSERGREEAARRLSQQRATESRLRGELEELRYCVYELKLSEISLSGRVEDLAEQNRSLREELGAKAPRDSECRTAPAGGSALVRGALDCAQDDFLPLPREAAPAPCGSHGQQQASIRPSEAPGENIPAGQPSEGSCILSCFGAGQGPSVWVPGLETTGKLLRALAGPEREQLSRAVPGLDEQILLLVCGCPPGQGMDGRVLPTDLACTSEQSPAATPAWESLSLMQMSTLSLWGLAWDPPVLPLQPLWEVSPGEPQIQEGLVSQATAQPGRDCYQTTSCTASLHQKFPENGPRGLEETWTEGVGAPGWRAEKPEEKRIGVRKEEGHGDKRRLSLESWEDLSPENGARAPEGERNGDGASETRAAAFCPWPRHELPTPLLQETSAAKEDPEALSRRGRGEACIWGLQGVHSSEKEEEALPAPFPRDPGAKGPPPTDCQFFVEQDRAIRRRVKGQEAKQHLGLDKAVLLLEASPMDQGQDREEKVWHQERASPGPRGVLEEPDVEGCDNKEMWFSVEEGGWPLFPGLSISAEDGEPANVLWAPSQGKDGYAPRIGDFEKEMEACFQQVSILNLENGGHGWKMSPLAGENWSFAQKWHGHENTYSKDIFTNHVSDIPSAEQAEPKEAGEGVRPGETEALGPRGDLPGMERHLGEMSPGSPARPSELPQPLGALGRVRGRFRQLIAELREERRKALLDNAKLRGDQERCHKKVCALERDRERNVKKISTLEQERGRLAGDVTHLKREVDQYLQLISDLEDCNGKSYSKISELEEENEKLKGNLGQIQKAMSENFQKSKGAMEGIMQENGELKALVSELAVSYKELIKDIVLGIEDMIQGLRGENGHLLRRICVLEREVALEVSADVGHLVKGEKHLQDKAKTTLVSSLDKAVQVPQLSEQLSTTAPGPSLQEDPALAGEQTCPSLCKENSRHPPDSMTPSLIWRNAEVSNALQENADGAGVNQVHLGKEEERARCSVDRGQAPWSPSQEPKLREAEAAASGEGLRLRVRQLRQETLTLRCQLRDQATWRRALQAAREEASGQRDELKDKLEELQKRQHEANLAVTPLEAKVASLVWKCQERNRLITQLLQKLRTHGAADALLSEVARAMVDDAALAEYVASFLLPEVRETSLHLDFESEKTAAVRAPNYLLNPEMDSVLQSSLPSESWPAPQAEWPAQIMPLDSPKPPLPLGAMRDPEMCPADPTVELRPPAPCRQEEGGVSCSALEAHGVPPPPELLSPARILAFYRELRESICGNSQDTRAPAYLGYSRKTFPSGASSERNGDPERVRKEDSTERKHIKVENIYIPHNQPTEQGPQCVQPPWES